MKREQSPTIKKLLQDAKDNFEENLSFLVANKNDSKLDDNRINIHKQIFNEINCLECGNCCKTTPAIILSSDIKRISKHLGMSKKSFERKYLMDDLTGDTVFNHVPCRFLLKDNTCEIYDVRPNACRQFPHTDEAAFIKRPRWNANNTTICPAAFLIVERLKKQSI